MKKIVERISQFIDGHKFEWDGFETTVWVPSQRLKRQMDIWSCGLFVLMALECIAMGHSYDEHCKDSLKEKMRGKCLNALMSLP